jgi:synaptotagmin-1
MYLFLLVAVLEARKLKKMDITGASDPYVKLKLFDAKQKRIGKKKKTSVKSCNLNPYWNESFVFIIDEMDMKRVTLDITVRRHIITIHQCFFTIRYVTTI